MKLFLQWIMCDPLVGGKSQILNKLVIKDILGENVIIKLIALFSWGN